jgi:hypothetical protein
MNDATELAKKSPTRLPGIPEHIQEYLLCIPFHLLFPFLPLLVERIVLGHVEDKTLLLFLAVYPLSIGVSSRSRLLFGITVVICLVFSTLFGLASGKIEMWGTGSQIGYTCLLAVMLIHACERYNRHVADRQPFWEFG